MLSDVFVWGLGIRGRGFGVATKYISNYMYWFKWLELFGNDKDAIKVKIFMVQCGEKSDGYY